MNSAFPCSKLPEDPGMQKLIGVYPQFQEDRFLQRVKIPGGRLLSSQWMVLAEISAQQALPTPLHLTTRQDIEIHNLEIDEIPTVQKRLGDAGLDCLGAAGDTFRNITVCTCSGLLTDTPDLMPLAAMIASQLSQLDGIYSLPRKFKISLSCSHECGQPWINDLGLVATRREGRWGFNVIVAGSLGRRPGTGIQLTDWIPASDVIPMAVAAIQFFAVHGDRENRRQARLRHVRQRMGDSEFCTLILEQFQTVRQEYAGPVPEIVSTGTHSHHLTLRCPNGDLSSECAATLSRLDPDKCCVVIDTHHGLAMFGDTGLIADSNLSRLPASEPAIVACPGRRWCKHSAVSTNSIASTIRETLGHRIPDQWSVCISGCPNGCAHPAIADIGLVGTRNEGREVFDILVNGAMGRGPEMSDLLEEKIVAGDVTGKISRYLDRQGI